MAEMAKIRCPETAARLFLEHYYSVLHIKPEESYGFYHNSSVATWDAKDAAKSLDGIREMIMSSDFNNCLVEIEDVHAQGSLQGSVLAVVSGCCTGRDNLKRKFIQTFVLVKQEVGFFVLNDVLRFVDEHQLSLVDSGTQTLNVSAEKPVQVSANVEKPVQVSVNIVEKSKPAPKTNGSDSTEAKVPDQKATTVPEAKSNDSAPKISYLEMLSRGKASSTPAPTTRVVKVSPFDGIPKEEKAKLSAPTNGSIKAKAIASISKNETKAETPQNETKEQTPPSNNAPQTVYAPRAIYVGGLPLNTTLNDLAHAVKLFGRVKKFDGVQVIVSDKTEDKYCFGFVHFQSPDSAKKAVEAQTIIVNGKEAYITYKRSRRRDENGARGRSPSRDESQSRTTSSSRGQSVNGETNNGGVKQNHVNGNDRQNDSRRRNNGYNNQRNDQRRNNGYNYQRNDQRSRNNGAAAPVQK